MQIPDSIAKTLNGRQADFFRTFFATCPDSFASNLMICRYGTNHPLISTDDSCGQVYILLKGRLQAIEERVADEPYSFTEIFPIDIVGDYELFTQASSRLITLTTVEESCCCVIPASAYLAWIRNDANALFLRIQMLISQMSDQNRTERQRFFLSSQDRLLKFLSRECSRQDAEQFPFSVRYTRQQLAHRLGCSVRTVNRTILKLAEEGLVTLAHGKLQISKQQYDSIRQQAADF